MNMKVRLCLGVPISLGVIGPGLGIFQQKRKRWLEINIRSMKSLINLGGYRRIMQTSCFYLLFLCAFLASGLVRAAGKVLDFTGPSESSRGSKCLDIFRPDSQIIRPGAAFFRDGKASASATLGFGGRALGGDSDLEAGMIPAARSRRWAFLSFDDARTLGQLRSEPASPILSQLEIGFLEALATAKIDGQNPLTDPSLSGIALRLLETPVVNFIVYHFSSAPENRGPRNPSCVLCEEYFFSIYHADNSVSYLHVRRLQEDVEGVTEPEYVILYFYPVRRDGSSKQKPKFHQELWSLKLGEKAELVSDEYKLDFNEVLGLVDLISPINFRASEEVGEMVPQGAL